MICSNDNNNNYQQDGRVPLVHTKDDNNNRGWHPAKKHFFLRRRSFTADAHTIPQRALFCSTCYGIYYITARVQLIDPALAVIIDKVFLD